MESAKPFSDYQLHPQLIEALSGLGFEKSTPIQDQAIPVVTAGKDVAGLAQTGTGKTAAFLLPLIERVLRSSDPTGDEELDKRAFTDWKEGHFNLVLVPTRELAEQVKDCALDFIKGTKHRVVVVYGGVSIEKQVEQIEKGFTFLVATPGRLIDLYKEHKIDLKQVRSVTFDEADRMFDMGFKDDMKFILRRIPDNRQLLLFSATLNLDVFNVAYQFGSDPVEIKVSQDKMTADNVDDWIFHLGTDEKPSHLLGIIQKAKPRQLIIFTNFKNQVERITEFLNKNGQKAVGISSLMTQAQRKQVMTRFRAEGGENILVATDVAARGLDIEGVDLVVNYELPEDAENYVHRIGRTGRAGEKGKAYSFVSDKDVEALDRIQSYLKRSLESEWLNDDELPSDFVAFPKGDLFARKPRSGSAPGKGPRRDDRRPRRKEQSGEGRRERRPRRDQNAAAPAGENREERSAQAGSETGKVHRDKRSGRHKNRESRPGEASKKRRRNRNDRQRNGSASEARGQKTSGRRDQSGRGKTKPPVKSSGGVLKKITNVFKGLFG